MQIIKRTFKGEVNTEPSCTDPSQNIELRTIVDRFVKGLPIPTVGRVLTPDDFDDQDNNSCPPEALDISEVKDLVDRANATIQELQRSTSVEQNSPVESQKSNETST